MNRKILIVDDDAEFLASVERQFETAQNIFEVVTATNGMEALNILKTTTIALVVSDLEMPEMDGFVLLAYIGGLYPDIPVIIMNEAGEAGAEDAARESGAAEYLEKPFTPKALLKTISEIYNKLSAGGELSDVSLEMFIQLFEMEQKTCTVRVFDKASGKTGALFFKNGEMMNARIEEVEGNDAAYEILSWNRISVSISDTCLVDDKLIQGDAQSVLLEAGHRRAKQKSDTLSPTPGAPGAADAATPADAAPKAPEGPAGASKLSNVSLEMFIQLYAMEERTGAITVENKEKKRQGVLYFKKGDIIDARLGNKPPNQAAYEILSWDKVDLSISTDCPVMETAINEDFQSMLLEAMRLKDEADMEEEDFAEEGAPPPKENAAQPVGEITLELPLEPEAPNEPKTPILLDTPVEGEVSILLKAPVAPDEPILLEEPILLDDPIEAPIELKEVVLKKRPAPRKPPAPRPSTNPPAPARKPAPTAEKPEKGAARVEPVAKGPEKPTIGSAFKKMVSRLNKPIGG